MTQQKIVDYQAGKGVYPSNSQIWHVAKDSNGDFSPDLLDKVYFGNTPAPKGHFILDAFNRDRDAVSGLSGVTTARDYDSKRPSTVTSFAGRIWYAGVGSNVYFSQIVTDIARAGRCYQEQDPTAEDFNQLLDTDGGVVPIADAGVIFKIAVVGKGVIVLADNGVWYISAGDQGFTPTSFFTSKVSDFGGISPTSVLEAEGSVYYVRNNGIHRISPTQFGVTVENITDDKIKNLITDLSSTALLYFYGAFDPISKKIVWLYNDTSSYNGASFRFKYNRVLIFDVRLQSFYTYTIEELSSDSPHVGGALATPNFTTGSRNDEVVVGTDPVVVGTDPVVVQVGFVTSSPISLKLITFVPNSGSTEYQITFSEFNNSNFTDWSIAGSGTGVDAPAFAVTGYEILGDPSKIKQASVVTYMNFTGTGFEDDGDDIVPTGDSSCFMRAEWDWATTAAANKYGSQQQVYRPRLYIPEDSNDPYDYGQLLVPNKTRIRGRGRSLSLRFDSEAGKDMQLVGWTTSFTAKTSI